MPKSKSKRKQSKGKKARKIWPQQKQLAEVNEGIEHSAYTGLEQEEEKANAEKPQFRVPGISERVEGFFQLAALFPFFVTAWIENGLVVKDPLMFTIVFGALLLGALSNTVRRKWDSIPFPGQLMQFVWCAAAGLSLAVYYVSENVEAAVLTACASFLRILCAMLEVESARALLLYCLGIFLSTSMLAPLGAFLGSGFVYTPFAVFGLVPALVLVSAELLRFSPLLERVGWNRVRYSVNAKGEEKALPGALTQLVTLVLISGPVLPAFLASLRYLPIPFMLTVVSLYPVPNLAEGFLKRTTAESALYWNVIRVALTATVAMFIAAQM